MSKDKKLNAKDYDFLFLSTNGLFLAILGEYLRIADKIKLKDIIIRDFLARGCDCLRSIKTTWNIRCCVDSWILYRCLMDRLLHLRYLERTNSYREFDDWSFKKQYEYQNKAKSDKLFKDRTRGKDFDLSNHTKRYRKIVKTGVVWERPKAEDVARDMGMKFLYDYGYDYASSFVHPMSNDGIEDFKILLNISNDVRMGDPSLILKNSLVISTMTIQEGINNSDAKWISLLYDCLDSIRNYLSEKLPEYLVPLKKLSVMVQEYKKYNLCEI